MSDLLSELTRLLIGVAVTAALVWICGYMPRCYVALKACALAAWGAISFGSPLFVAFAIDLPAHRYALAALSLALGGVCMAWPFLRFGWRPLLDCFRKGATGRP